MYAVAKPKDIAIGGKLGLISTTCLFSISLRSATTLETAGDVWH